jgi:UDP-N-acetylmuramoyl-L-alanyl-D-glutamate--2,6-diaminopimelate ligase
MKFSEILQKAFGGMMDKEVISDFEINKLCYNSNRVEEGDVFFAIKGFMMDGNDFIKDAVARGALAVISDVVNYRNNIPVYKVEDCRETLALMSNAYFGYPSSKMKIIGVTGTNGKTTVTHLINHVLEQSGKKTGLIGTNGNIINKKILETKYTTPESLELNELLNIMYNEGVEYVTMEVSSHALALNRVYGLDFDAAVFTNLTAEHMDFHKNMEDYFNTKKILFDSMKRINSKNNRTYAVYNIDDDSGSGMVTDTESERISYGFKRAAYTAGELKMDFSGMSFIMTVPANGEGVIKIPVETNLIGRFNVYNILASAACLKNFGISYDVIRDGVADFQTVAGRFNQIKLANGAIAIIDYSHTPDSLSNVLTAIRELLDESALKAKVITVFGCGGNRDRAKRPVMGRIAAVNSDHVIITSDNPRFEKPLDIIEEIKKGIITGNYEVEPDREKAIGKAMNLSRTGDIILIAGKGHENYQEIEGVRYPMSDIEIAGRYR